MSNIKPLQRNLIDLQSLNYITERCNKEPMHVKRDISKTDYSFPSVKEASVIFQERVLPMLFTLKEHLAIPWIEHVMEPCQDGDWEHVSLPKPVYEAYRPVFDVLGFTEAIDTQQWATQDGLKEALLGGADLSKKWH